MEVADAIKKQAALELAIATLINNYETASGMQTLLVRINRAPADAVTVSVQVGLPIGS